jgi:hypothetical protein
MSTVHNDIMENLHKCMREENIEILETVNDIQYSTGTLGPMHNTITHANFRGVGFTYGFSTCYGETNTIHTVAVLKTNPAVLAYSEAFVDTDPTEICTTDLRKIAADLRRLYPSDGTDPSGAPAH